MADSKHTITINTKATPATSTPTQTVAPSQIARPVFSQPERQSMVNKQAYSIRDEQAAQGISIPWGEALRQANKEWKGNVEAANALADTEHESIVTPASQTISDEVVGPEILEDGLDSEPIDTDTISLPDGEELAIDPQQVIDFWKEGIEPVAQLMSDLGEAAVSDAFSGKPIDVVPSSQILSQKDTGEDTREDIGEDAGTVIFGDKPPEPVIPTSTRPTFDDDDEDIIDLAGAETPEDLQPAPDPLDLGSLGDLKPDYGRQGWGPYSDDMQAVVESGLGGSSRSATTAIQATGAMALQPVKAGRDIMAEQLEQSAMGAKVAVSLLSGGNVNPSSSGGGGGGASDVLSFAGGDGGGGGGGIDEMLGGKIDDIFAGPLKPVDMFVDGMETAVDKLATWTAAIEESYEEVMGFSAVMIGARVETELGILQKQIERGQELGNEFASFEDARGGLLLAFEDLKTVLLQLFLPITKLGLKILSKILEIITNILKTVVELYDIVIQALVDIFEVLAWLTSLDPLLGPTIRVTLGLLRQLERNTAPQPTDFDSLGGWLQTPKGSLPTEMPFMQR